MSRGSNTNPQYDSVTAGQVYLNDLFIKGEKFVNLDQTELQMILDNLSNIQNNATAISNLQSSDITQNNQISALQSTDATHTSQITTLQSTDATHTSQITTLQNKTSYWNSNGTMYNHNDNVNLGITSLTAQTAVIIAGSDNSFMQVGGSSGISIEGGANGLYLSSVNDVIIDTKDSDKNIRIGMNTSGNYGNATIDIGGGGSLIRIGNEQTTVAIPPANGPVIYIGQKNNVKSDSTTHLEGDFLLTKAQFTDLSGSSAITWEQLGALIPTVGIPAFCLSFILTSSIPNFVYSDLWGLKATAFQKLGEAETVLSPKCKSLVIFNSELVTVTEPALKVFTLRGTSSISTLEGDNNIYTFWGKNVIRCDSNGVLSGRIDDGDYNSIITDTNYTQINASYGNLELVALGNANIDFYAGSAVRNIHKKSTMSIKNDRRILMSYDSVNKTPSTDARLTIKNATNVLGTPQETNLLVLENENGSVVSTFNATNINNQSLTLASGYSGTTTATLYKDVNNNLFWNGRNISNYTAGTASTYIFSISSNVTTPPAVGTLNLTYTSTPSYYINYTGYSVATELEVGSFTSPNIDLIANPFISAGLWSFNYHTTLTANIEVRSYFKVYVQETVTATNNSTTTLLKDGSSNYVLLTPSGTLGTYALTYNELFIDYYQFPNLTTCTYKIIIKMYIYQPSGTTSHNVRFGFNDTSLSHVHTTFQNVSATSTLQNVLIAGNTCGNTPINMNGQALQNCSDILPQSNNDLVIGSKASSTGKTYIYANAAPKITATSSGVGIGSTTSPAYPLDVGGDINLTGNLKINGVTQSFGGSQNLSSVLTNGNTASTSINMNGNNITGANTITASTFTGGSGGKIVCHPSSDETTIGKFLNPLDAGGYSLYTQSIKCNGAITAAGYYIGNEIYKPLEWDWQGVTKATSSSTYFVKWDSVLESLPIMSLAYDWELELRFSNYLAAYSYIGLLLNGDTATNEQIKNSHWGHEFQMWANTSAVQVFTTNIAFSKCFPKNNDYNDFIYRLRLCWDQRNNVLVNYVNGICYRWYNGLTTGATDYETCHGVQVIHNTAYLTETGGETPSINSIRFQSWTTTQDLFRRATLKIKRVAKRWS